MTDLNPVSVFFANSYSATSNPSNCILKYILNDLSGNVLTSTLMSLNSVTGEFKILNYIN